MCKHCDRSEDIKEVKTDIKEIKVFLYTNFATMVGVQKDVELHGKLWKGLIGIIISIGVGIGLFQLTEYLGRML